MPREASAWYLRTGYRCLSADTFTSVSSNSDWPINSSGYVSSALSIQRTTTRQLPVSIWAPPSCCHFARARLPTVAHKQELMGWSQVHPVLVCGCNLETCHFPGVSRQLMDVIFAVCKETWLLIAFLLPPLPDSSLLFSNIFEMLIKRQVNEVQRQTTSWHALFYNLQRMAVSFITVWKWLVAVRLLVPAPVTPLTNRVCIATAPGT